MHKRTFAAISLLAVAFAATLAARAETPPLMPTRPPRTVYESDANLDITRRVAGLLTRAGVTTVLTRTPDVTRTPAERIWVADRYRADAFVSIHNNSASASAADHSEVYRQVAGGRSATLATAIAAAFEPALGEAAKVKARRGSGGDYYWQLRMNGRRPSVLVESAFVSNRRQAWLLGTSPEFLQRIAGAIAAGILEYQRTLAAPAPGVPDPGVSVESDLVPVARSLQASVSGRDRVALRWIGSTAASRYLVYRDGLPLAYVATNAALTAAAAPEPLSLTFTDRWAAPGQRYDYRIVALRDAVVDAASVQSPSLRSAAAGVSAQTPAITVCLDAGHGGKDPGAIGRW